MAMNNKLLEFRNEIEEYNLTKDPEILYRINKLINENRSLLDHVSVNTSDNFKFLRICSIFTQFLF